MIGVWNWLRSYTIDIYWMSLYSVDNIKEKLVISLYAKGMSVSDIEEEMREIYEIEPVSYTHLQWTEADDGNPAARPDDGAGTQDVHLLLSLIHIYL